MTDIQYVNDLNGLSFNNRFTKDLPADSLVTNQRRQVYEACYSRVSPTPVSNPKLIAWSEELATELELDRQTVLSDRFREVVSGNELLKGMDPYAMCYGGHQFGNWAGQLGDGRAINLGEVKTSQNNHYTLQLKGAGPTPYSRTADGLAVLRSSVREFLCSEAMHHLGIPTTRALSLTLTGEQVLRDMFYDGHPAKEPGAVVCRVAPSFLRLGSYEIFTSRGDINTLKTLVDYTIRHHFSHITSTGKDAYIEFFSEVCERTADMIIHWQRVGFVHGVMNTDNLSVLGLTIDYGPYGWLEDFNNNWTPNTTDAQHKRYSYGNQAKIGQWNLVRFANALYPLIEESKPLEDALHGYGTYFDQGYNQMMANKLGLTSLKTADDEKFLGDLESLLEATETDMTLFYRSLNMPGLYESDSLEFDFTVMSGSLYSPDTCKADYRQHLHRWLNSFRDRANNDSLSAEKRSTLMNNTNPLYVLRNYLAQLAIDDATNGDYSRIEQQLDILRTPYQKQENKQQFAEKRPEWARERAGCSMLSCSS